jgi:CDP-diacylglycerol--serine O-phosphatidyltransferase
MVLVPALLMVSTIRFRSFKTFDLGARRGYAALLLVAVGLALLAAQPEVVLVAMAYTYLASGLIGWVLTKYRKRGDSHDTQKDTPAGKDAVPGTDAVPGSDAGDTKDTKAL